MNLIMNLAVWTVRRHAWPLKFQGIFTARFMIIEIRGIKGCHLDRVSPGTISVLISSANRIIIKGSITLPFTTIESLTTNG